MNGKFKILQSAQEYIKQYDLDCTPEEIFAHFAEIEQLHIEFEKHLADSEKNIKLKKMNRSEQLLAKRKIFAEWYLLKNQNEKLVKQIIIDISEMVFASPSTVEKDIYKGNSVTTD